MRNANDLEKNNWDPEILNRLAKLDRYRVTLTQSEMNDQAEIAKAIYERDKRRTEEEIRNHCYLGFAGQKAVYEVLGDLCIPGVSKAVKSHEEWAKKIAPGGDVKLNSTIMHNPKLEVKTKQISENRRLDSEHTTLFAHPKSYENLMRLGDRSYEDHHDFVLANKGEVIDLDHYRITASILFSTHGMSNFFRGYKDKESTRTRYHHMIGRHNQAGKLIYFDPYVSGHNGSNYMTNYGYEIFKYEYVRPSLNIFELCA